MLDRLIEQATAKRVLISLLLLLMGGFLLFSYGYYSEVSNLNQGKPLPEEQFSSLAFTQEFLARMGPQGREIYARFQLLDLLNPILICPFLVFFLGWLIKRSQRTKQLKLILVLPFLLLLGELWENSLLYAAARLYPSIPTAMETHQIALYLKFGGLMLSLLSIVILVCLLIFKANKKN